MKELQKLNNSKKGLIIHHWDTDGLCSAALLLRFFAGLNKEIFVDLKTPTINNYFLTEQQYQEVDESKYDFIITCDINFPATVVQRLAKIKPEKVFVFDHHKQDSIDSVFYYNKRYPSCTLVLREYLNIKHDFLTALGCIGDKEDKILEDPIMWPIIENQLKGLNLSFPEMLHIRNLVDSCYMSDDYTIMTETVRILQIDPLIVSQDVNLRDNLNKTNKELQKVITKEPGEKVDDKIFIFSVNSLFNILSHSIRALSRKYNNKIVVGWLSKNNQTNIYVRRRDLDIDISPLIKWARNMGCNSGGKEEVVGIIYNGQFSNIKDELVGEIKKII